LDRCFEDLTNLVDFHIRHLCAKIDAGHEKKWIRTVRGVGYAAGRPAA
jgi:DNA-binding response OmpR family regulator